LKRIHLLRVEESPARFEELMRAATEKGLRIGWLEFEGTETPEPLAAAATSGAFRAVAVGEQETVSVKTRVGAAVMRDLLREYFQGCSLVLVSGDDALALLRSHETEWEVVSLDGAQKRFGTAELIAALKRMDPFDV
jgi:hypothetical protein